MTEGNRITALMEDVEIDALAEWLVAASEEQRAEARRWLREHGDDLLWDRADRGDYSRAGAQRRLRQPWFVALLTVAVEPPVAAASAHALAHANDTLVPRGPNLLLRVVRSRGERWVRDFVPAAAQRQANTAVHQVLAALVEELGLPFPEGIGFLRGWVVSMRFTEVATMSERMLADPLAPGLVHTYLAGPDVTPDPPVLAAAVPLVTAGIIDRDALVAQAVEVLTTVPRVGAQRAIASLLSSLGLTLDDLPGGVPFGQGLVATCHGSVGALLLPVLLAGLSTADELAELSTTIAGRPERAQKTVLLRALGGRDLQGRVGVPAVLDALDVLRQASDDEKLLTQVETLAARLGGRTAAVERPEPVAVGLWSLDPPGAPVVVRQVTGPSVVDQQVAQGVALELRNGQGDTHRLDMPIRVEQCLAALVGHAHLMGEKAVRDWLVTTAETYAERPGHLGEAIVDWLADPGVESFREAYRRAGEVRTDGTGHAVRPYSLMSGGDAFPYLLAREALLRLGRSPALLSTPSHADHTLGFDALTERVARCQGSSVGPLDLLQALLRLRPVEPDRLSALDGMSLPVDDDVTTRPAELPVRDAAELIRSFVLGGGLHPLHWRVEPVEHNHPRWTADSELGVLTGLAALAPQGFLNDSPEGYSSTAVARTLPQWPDRAYRPFYALPRPEHQSAPYGMTEYVLTREWPIDLPLYDDLLARMASPDRRKREAAARTALELIGQQRFDADRFTRIALMRLEAGVLVLPRIAGVWDLIAQAGGLRALWPVMGTAAATACSSAPVPAGTPDLLRLITSLLPEVPEPAVPPEVRSFAARRGSTKAQFEARRLVETADRQAGS